VRGGGGKERWTGSGPAEGGGEMISFSFSFSISFSPFSFEQKNIYVSWVPTKKYFM
jgi:hypothetical protein